MWIGAVFEILGWEVVLDQFPVLLLIADNNGARVNLDHLSYDFKVFDEHVVAMSQFHITALRI